jgi:hypothetical protein
MSNEYSELAAAIREGAKLAPQLFYPSAYQYGGKTCALGAAIAAVNGGVVPDDASNDHLATSQADAILFSRFPFLRKNAPGSAAHCPLCDYPTQADFGMETCSELFAVICHLNGVHRKPREWIAEWVASLSEQRTTEPSHRQLSLSLEPTP